MPSLGSKKKDNSSRMERNTKNVPKLSNEMQLSIMNKVKTGELSIEDALSLARKDQLLKQQSPAEEEQQYNFSIYKHSHYRWQKRVLQIDFKTSMVCSIEKGIIRRQLPFAIVKSCDDGVGSRFSISFKGRHDYELEATSVEDKHKIMQLVNQIIYRNIYSDPEERNSDALQQPQTSKSIREGTLLLHRGGLASFKWVKYEAQLHPGQLTLVPCRADDGEAPSSVLDSFVIHLSDGDTSVRKPQASDTFTLITHKNEYQFKVPSVDETSGPGAVQRERDAWVQAVDKLCVDWKRKSMGEHMFVGKKLLRNQSIAEETENNNTDLESNCGFKAGSVTTIYPPADYANAKPTSGGGDHLSAGDMSQSPPSANYTKPIPKPRRNGKTENTGPDVLPPTPSPSSPSVLPLSSSTSPPPSPSQTALTSVSTVPESLSNESGSSAVMVPPPPRAPPPPPLPLKLNTISRKTRTKAFHWDQITSEKFKVQARGEHLQSSPLSGPPQGTDAVKRYRCGGGGGGAVKWNQYIFLKSFPVQPGELKDKLFIINEEDGGLSDEHITSLRRYVPTIDDVEMYKSYKGPVTDLHTVDQYMMAMCSIPILSTQLNLLLTLRELPISMNDLQPLINQKIRMCTQLYNCRSFVSVLKYLLTIGNYLNENAGKEKAKGFRLSSLTKLSQLRGRDKKFTLLNALVEQIMLHEPCLATFTQDLAEFETVPGVLKNELQKVIQYRKNIKKRNTGAHPPNFTKDLKMAIEKYNTDLSALTKTCEEMKKLYSVVLVKFGELPDQDSQELFGVISQFVHDFRRAHAEIQ
ncbi:Delphilin Glutamate receptor, ionotropic, delta 2-interacting protein 1 [Channa argus]|uniref:Delphilin Glutamate receptor, ionotropic, delta 2-interacting protein 1 n=1 Tax=Channa argus TaxID=215402 RepID=A0A6G1Q461_CHAAH|nr:Delphilin Glutamate receptor, ionotropic, delta 2-interacting protein 1 [Channa argus]